MLLCHEVGTVSVCVCMHCTENRSVKYGDTVTLLCKASSDVDVKWTQTDTTSHVYVIYSDGAVFDNIRDRFAIVSTMPGEYNLQMLRANPSDAGRYVCDELNHGSRTVLSQYYLTVPG